MHSTLEGILVMKKVIEIKDLSVSFTQNNELVKAVQKSNFFINEGECFSIVGESGSGKSVTAMSMMKLIKESNNTLYLATLNLKMKTY